MMLEPRAVRISILWAEICNTDRSRRVSLLISPTVHQQFREASFSLLEFLLDHNQASIDGRLQGLTLCYLDSIYKLSKRPTFLGVGQGFQSAVLTHTPKERGSSRIKTSCLWPFSRFLQTAEPFINRSQSGGRGERGEECVCERPDTVISPFMALLISSQDATINIELLRWLLLCCSLQVRPLAHASRPCRLYMGDWRGWRKHGEPHAFIIKVSWEALRHLEVLKRALLRVYVGIAQARKLALLPTVRRGGIR